MLPLPALRYRTYLGLLDNHRSRRLLRFYSQIKMSSEPKWKQLQKQLQSLPLDEKRKLYRVGDYITLDNIYPWCDFVIKNKDIKMLKPTQEDLKEFQKITIDSSRNKELAKKVSIYQGDITKLEIDAIVNAANARLVAGGGVDGAIHRAAGTYLQEECNRFHGCPTGDAKITGGYYLPAKYVIQTVGPRDGSVSALESCYEKCLSYHDEYKIRTIAFPCIATGIYGFPNRLAAHIALRTARQFLEAKNDMVRIIFSTFMPADADIYKTLMQVYFPVDGEDNEASASE